jgi:hypothetical protein
MRVIYSCQSGGIASEHKLTDFLLDWWTQIMMYAFYLGNSETYQNTESFYFWG